MTTSGTKGQHFTCQMKMESEVACAHSVTLTATVGLTIDKAGVVGAELGYTYPAGQGLIAQDVGILPTSCGDGKLFAAITSPYFVTPSGLKIKRDVIDIQVECEEPDGWKGSYCGFVWGSASPATWTDPSLQYKYTHIGGTVTLQFSGVTGVTKEGPESGGVYSAVNTPALTATMPGTYIFKVYLPGVFQSNNNPASLLTTIAVAVTIGALPPVFAAPRRRGVVWVNNNTGISPPNTNFSLPFGAVRESYSPGPYINSFSIATISPSPGFTGTVTVSGATATATGKFFSVGSIFILRQLTAPDASLVSIGQTLDVVQP